MSQMSRRLPLALAELATNRLRDRVRVDILVLVQPGAPRNCRSMPLHRFRKVLGIGQELEGSLPSFTGMVDGLSPMARNGHVARCLLVRRQPNAPQSGIGDNVSELSN